MEFLKRQIDLAYEMGFEAHVYDMDVLMDQEDNQFGITYMVEPVYAGSSADDAKAALEKVQPFVEFVAVSETNGGEYKVGEGSLI
jgi:hypothetical protein